MKVTFFGLTSCRVTREEGDPKFYGRLRAAGESRFLYHLKKELNSMGYDFIKKRIQKDGHMVGDEYQQYLRARRPERLKEGGIYCILNDSYAIRGAEEDFNKLGEVWLKVERA